MDTLQLNFLPILVIGFAASLSLTPISRAIALRIGFVDKPAARKLHSESTPLLGGLAIYIALAFALIVFSPPQHMREFAALLSGAALLALVGALDDKYNLSVRIRLVAMTIAALVVIAAGIRVELFGSLWLDVPITVIWILAVTNAVNFNDNMDGLAAGLTGIASGFFMVIAFTQELSLVSALAAALLGSAVGFLIYNFNPARTFMGDMGSLVLGFVLAILAIKLEFGTQPLGVTWMIPLLVLALPLADIVLVLITRFVEGRPLTQGGKDHMSHRIMSLGLSQRKTIAVLYSFCFVFGALAMVVSLAEPPIAWTVGVLSLIALAIWLVLMAMIWQRARQKR
ncbi:MAG: undecaprenyl/decaprenyl-phosphate alpha-N-acetylglucosaminyl 1-phosphate transferase [Anaerolineae bacterium]|nr:undecaprenyl/decaprenyl-phosphate alpha-N-acetylglucosaminyl 1-phosphate transferase [Anaerolineae bacterium]